ncbi:MAG TPA: tyrosine-protein phosphatase [Virgibacillus sp.]|nr:tyrosine-protein phosphatase [Virgibacillus sp.]HLR68496.1 tyrosine-protein phosphatase [Virgibacillus sp.]
MSIKNAKLNWVRLPLDRLENCRELGGYNTKYGEQIKWHTFLRSSNMSNLTQEDMAFLKEYGVKTVIDLREEDEIKAYQNPLAEMDFCNYHNIPFFAQQISKSNLFKEPFLGDSYVKILEQIDSMKRIFDTIDQASEGCVVFHCMAGKDRTGILAMLLLGIAGVEKKDIISNYEVTYTNLESLHAYKDLYEYESIPKAFLYSRREYILRAYEHIVHSYQSFDHYLMAKGVERGVIDRVRRRLLGVGETVTMHGNFKG